MAKAALSKTTKLSLIIGISFSFFLAEIAGSSLSTNWRLFVCR